jgi:hypothetical protein
MNSIPQWVQILMTACGGSAIGTLVKALIRPEPHLGRWFAQLIAAFFVGGLAGSAAIEYFQLTTFVGCAAAGSCALIAEEIVRGIQARGRRLRNGNLDLTAGGGDSDDR